MKKSLFVIISNSLSLKMRKVS